MHAHDQELRSSSRGSAKALDGRTDKKQANRRLRVGILLDSLESSSWVFKILSELQSANYAEISLVVLNHDTPTPPPGFWSRLHSRIKDAWRRGLFNRYLAWDYNRTRGDDDPFAPKNIHELIQGVPVLRVVPLRKKFTDRFQESDLKKIREADLDVLLRFGFRIIKGEILNAARHGVWSYHHGDNREYRGGPALFWEIYEQNPVSGTVLQILNERLDGGKVIYRSFGHTELDSLYLNRKSAYWKTAEFMLRRLRDLHRFGGDYLDSLAEDQQDEPYHKAIYRTPTNGQMLKFLARKFGRAIRNRLRRLLPNQDLNWFIAYRSRSNVSQGWQILCPPPNHFYADPFLFKQKDRTYLFFEDYLYDSQKGVISMVELFSDGTHSSAKRVLEIDVHLSYPLVFENAGEIYLIPEINERNQVELYRATHFPDQWTLDRVLIDNISAVDPTLHYQDDTWWLFINIAVPGASSWDELHLYYADSLNGPWTAHPKNPIVSDVRSARPAGWLFTRNGQLIRPAQDCSVAYGHSLTLNRVEELTKSEYHESPIERINPDWFDQNLATHTINFSDEFEVRDGKMSLRRLRGKGSAH